MTNDHTPIAVAELGFYRRGYGIALDALYTVKETIAFAKMSDDPITVEFLLKAMDEAYDAAAHGCQVDLRNPYGAEEARKILMEIDYEGDPQPASGGWVSTARR